RWLRADLAVETFFVISGFYMQLVLSTRYTREKLGNGWWLRFYTARYLRLLPIYLSAALLVVGTCLVRSWLQPHSHGGPEAVLGVWNDLSELPNTYENFFFKSFFVLTNLTMFFQEGVNFLAVHGGNIVWSENFWDTEVYLYQGLVIPQAWSLGVELSFYVTAPYLLNLRSRWLILIACIGLAIKVFAMQTFELNADSWGYRFFPFELPYFLLGAIAFRFRRFLQGPGFNHEKIGMFCTYLIVIALTAFSLEPAGFSIFFYPIAFAFILPFVFRMTAKLKIDRLIGELSYPFYIFHLFALMLVGLLPDDTSFNIKWMGLGLTLALSAIALALEFRFIEPWRVRFAERQPATSDIEFAGSKNFQSP